MVRSKSEQIIYDALIRAGIPFRYEAKLYINGKYFVPDFTILLPDGTPIYWEHFGMTIDADYMLANKRKLEIYEEYGITQWNNLIVTFDNIRYGLSSAIVDGYINDILSRF